MDPAAAAAAVPPPVTSRRSTADLVMRRLLLLPTDPSVDGDPRSLFGKSILVSTVRCLLTYVFLPVLAPIVDLSTGVGPIVGLLIGAVSIVAIVVAIRRFFAADHRWRWGYTAIGGSVLVLLVIQAVADVATFV